MTGDTNFYMFDEEAESSGTVTGTFTNPARFTETITIMGIAVDVCDFEYGNRFLDNCSKYILVKRAVSGWIYLPLFHCYCFIIKYFREFFTVRLQKVIHFKSHKGLWPCQFG
jgi:hypothetical protein